MKPKISEVLHLAADKHLSETGNYSYDKEKFSCCAVTAALDELVPEGGWWQFEYEIFNGLDEMGCDCGSANLFKKYGDGFNKGNAEVQGMRYFWLKWAALMAEEQGR